MFINRMYNHWMISLSVRVCGPTRAEGAGLSVCHSGKRCLWLDGSEERSALGPKVRPSGSSHLFHLETRPLMTEATPTVRETMPRLFLHFLHFFIYSFFSRSCQRVIPKTSFTKQITHSNPDYWYLYIDHIHNSYMEAVLGFLQQCSKTCT